MSIDTAYHISLLVGCLIMTLLLLKILFYVHKQSAAINQLNERVKLVEAAERDLAKKEEEK